MTTVKELASVTHNIQERVSRMREMLSEFKHQNVMANLEAGQIESVEVVENEKLDEFDQKIRDKQRLIDNLENMVAKRESDSEMAKKKNQDYIRHLENEIRMKQQEIDAIKKGLEL